MNILHLISGLAAQSGGPQVALAGFAANQKQAGLDVTIAYTWVDDADRDLESSIVEAGVRVVAIGPAAGPTKWHRDTRRIVGELIGQADVIHIHGVWESLLHEAAAASRRLGKPYVFTPHGMLEPWSLQQKWWKKTLYLIWRLRQDLNRAAAIHYITDSEQQLVRPLRLKAPAIIEPIGLDFDEFDNAPPRGSFRGRLPNLADKSIVLFLGRLHHKKGLDLLVNAVAGLDQNVALVIAGPDSDGYKAEMQRLIDAAGLGKRAVFVGMLKGADRIAAFQDADLFVLPSRQENFGIAVVEAMAAGTPVLISDQVGLSSEIRAAGVGSVVPLDVAKIRDEIRRLLANPELRGETGARAAKFARDRYRWREIVDRWTNHYQRMIDLSKLRGAS